MAEKRKTLFGFMAIRRKGENDAKTQISLEQGTGEYKEYLLDKQGVPEVEQDRQRAADAGLLECDPFQPEDKWHTVEAEEAANIAPAMDDRNEALHGIGNGVITQKHDKQTKKRLLVDDAQAQATDMALATPEKDDDKQAAQITRRVPELIYDDGVLPEEFVPSALQKYM